MAVLALDAAFVLGCPARTGVPFSRTEAARPRGRACARTDRDLPGNSQLRTSETVHNEGVNARVAGTRSDPRSPQQAEARLLVVEDDPNIIELLSASLRFAGFEVATAREGHEALRAAREFQPDLIVLDVMMPGIDGFEVLRRLGSEGVRCPVIFLTAKDATADKITGLTVGGDDYITKPFSLDEVLARIRAVLRRSSAGPEPAQARMAFADIELDDDTHEVWKGGAEVPLSPTEFKLLRYFMENAGRVLSKAQILDHVWHYDFGGDGNVVESYVSYLRRKIDTTEPRLLHTLRGVGYVLRSPRT
jgi:two-component system OmpR family response regulator